MENEGKELKVTEQDVAIVSKILEENEEPFPIESEESQSSDHLNVSEEFMAWFQARKKRLQTRNLQEKTENIERLSHRQRNEAATLERQEIQSQQMQQAEAQEQKEKSSEPQSTLQNAKKEYMDFQLLQEGKYQIGCLRKIWRRHITYIREEKELSTLSKKICFFYYILKEAEANCKVSSMLMAFGSGTASMEFGRNEECMEGEGKKHIKRALCRILISWLALAAIVWVWLTTDTGDRPILIFVLIIGILFILPIINNVLKGPWIIKEDMVRNGKRKKSQQVTAKFFEKTPDFCLEKLISGLNSKMLRLIYADEPEEIRDIADGDMTGFLQDQANVVECDIRNIWFSDLREDRDNMYLDVTYQVALDRDMGDRIEQGFKDQLVKLQLTRPVLGMNETDLYRDWKIVKIEV